MLIHNKWMKRLLLALGAGIAGGCASALFLASLDAVTHLQTTYVWLLWLLPFGGAFVSYIYVKLGYELVKGNNLIFEQIHSGRGTVPLRMAPLVLIGTLVTHLFGGSAGREGTAVQMGSSLASGLGRAWKLDETEARLLILCGISAGFGSVFGTPIAAAMFGLEAAAGRKLRFEALLPCLLASYTGHYVTLGWGISHIHYSMGDIPAFSWTLLAKVCAAAIAFGLAALLFARLTSSLKNLFARAFASPVLRSFVGGLIIIALVYALGSRDYLGLSLPLLGQSFQESVSPFAFALKTLFTSVTLGSGFLGGEVTPLFVIGSALGSAMSAFLSLPPAFLAGLGLAAVFGAAAKTPLACAFVGIELFGIEAAFYFFLVCFASSFISGKPGIYASHVRYYVPKR